MRSAQQKSYSISFLAFTAIITLTGGVAAQSQEDETQTDSPKTGTITGRVINENGQPLANASVFVRGSIPLMQARIVTTDSEGNFQVSDLERAMYGVSASTPAYVSAPINPESVPLYYRIGESVRLTLIKGGVITGTVMSASGETLVQIEVRAILVRDANGQPPKYPTYQLERTTDDRGIYRLYGLLPGTYVVSAGGLGAFNYTTNAYDTDAPIYAPSSTRDTAAEIAVRAGEETSGVDIRYRGEPGRVVSGTAHGPTAPNSSYSRINVTLMQISNGVPQASAYSYQRSNSRGFVFYGVADGDYDLTAQSSLSPGETAVSEPRRIVVKGADVTGIELTIKPLGSISGRIALENSTAPECKNKRQPLFSETLVTARRHEKRGKKNQPRLLRFFTAQGSPNKAGDFMLRNLAPGEHSLSTRFFAKYWYFQAITLQMPAAPTATERSASVNRPVNAARSWVNLKLGERLTGLTITLAEGAASLRGRITGAESDKLPPNLFVYLIPTEKEQAEDVLRFFTTAVTADGSFSLGNLPPGRYWAITRIVAENRWPDSFKLRMPDEADNRVKLRRDAELAKTSIELKPCQNVLDYQLPFKSSSMESRRPGTYH
jgi:hypothetical protein